MRYFTPTKLSENIHETPEGYLLCLDVPIGRTGEMIYGKGETPLEHGPDGTVNISRSEEDVFAPEAMASFEGKPVTIGHPEDFLDPGNWKELAKGVMQNIRRGDGDHKDSLLADLLITDAIAIGLVKNGLREVSCGYECEYTQTGEGTGTQSSIIGNHIALVDEGRAGSKFAINDHKWKGFNMNKFAEKVKGLFGKALDEALKEEKKDEPAKDEMSDSYDAVMQAVKDLSEKIQSMAPKAKDADADKDMPKKDAPKKDADAGDADPDEADAGEAGKSVEDRLTYLETAVAKVMEMMSDSDSDLDSDASDEDMPDMSDTGDADADGDKFKGVALTGDEASRVEILAPGMKAQGKDAKAKALVAAYQSKDGKGVIDSLTKGKGVQVKDSAAKIDSLFVSVSEILKATRGNGLRGSKSVTEARDSIALSAISPEEMNEKNARYWAEKKGK